MLLVKIHYAETCYFNVLLNVLITLVWTIYLGIIPLLYKSKILTNKKFVVIYQLFACLYMCVCVEGGGGDSQIN